MNVQNCKYMKFSNFDINKPHKKINSLFERFSCLLEKSPNRENNFSVIRSNFRIFYLFISKFELFYAFCSFLLF